MDSKINLGLLCLMSLMVVCHAASTNVTNPKNGTTSTNVTTSTNGTTPTSTPTTTPTTSVSVHPPKEPQSTSTTTLLPSPTTTTTKPTEIECLVGSCEGKKCSNFNASQICPLKSTIGCQTVTSTAKNVTTYTFSCSKSKCKPDDKTKCCTASKCNTYAAAQQKSQKGNYASSMFGNLVSITIIMLMVLFF